MALGRTVTARAYFIVYLLSTVFRLYESALRSCSVFAPVDALQAVFSATVIEVVGILRKFAMETSLTVQKQAALASMTQVCLYLSRLATGALLLFCIVELQEFHCIFMSRFQTSRWWALISSHFCPRQCCMYWALA